MLYQIFKWVHIISYICWLIAFAGSLWMAAKVREAGRADRKHKFMHWERRITNIGAHIGAMGILISGSAMAWLPAGPQWGWFNFRLYPWLGVKQVLFVIILFLVAWSIKKSKSFKETLKTEGRIGPEISAQWSAAYRLSLLIYMLVVINTFLGFSKPF